MKHDICNQKGFTLIEVSIVILVLGLLLATFIPAYDLWRTQIAIDETQNNVERVSDAMGQFRQMHGRYPRPAPFDAVAGNLNYGRETSNTLAALSGITNDNCTAAGDLVCMQGTIDTDGSRQADALDGSGTQEDVRIIVGAIPFKDLGLNEDQAYDGFGNRLTYSVTANLTDSDIFDESEGGIEIRDASGDPVLLDPESGDTAVGHYLVFSHGENGDGAFTRAGVRRDCGGLGGDRENLVDCGGTVNAGFAVYTYADWDRSGTDDYDDFMMYSSQADISAWQTSQVNPDDIHLINVSAALSVRQDETGALNDGDLVLQTGGDLRATGNTRVNRFCNENETNCFNASLFAGDPGAGTGGIQCPTGQYITGVQNNAFTCSPVRARCPGGDVIAGVNGSGEIICASTLPSNCAADTRDVCGTPQTLTAANDGETRTLTGGDNMTHVYECDDGNWVQTSTSGYCNCLEQLDPVIKVNVCDTTAVMGSITPYTGSVTQTITEACVGGLVTSTTTWSGGTSVSDCSCSNVTDTANFPCSSAGYGPAFTGSVTRQATFDCSSGTWGSYGAPTADTCTCDGLTTPRPDEACTGVGMTGVVTVTATNNCMTGNIDINRDYSGCTCVPQVTSTTDICDPATHTTDTLQVTSIVCDNGPNLPGTVQITTPGVCTPKTHRYLPNGPAFTTGASTGGIELNASCSYLQAGKKPRAQFRGGRRIMIFMIVRARLYKKG